MHVRYSYLPQQFADISGLMKEIEALVRSGDFTLGEPLGRFERSFAALLGARHAIGVGSGTDALKLPLRALGVGHGDEVITTANTFIATVGAIAEVGATPVFVDCDDSFCMDVSQLAAAITPRTKAIMPVHYTGYMTEMPALLEIAKGHDLPVVEDACQGILADIGGKRAGTWGIAGGFSLHPLKNLNVWGDGGVIVTDDDAMAEKLRLLRNHGMLNRDEIAILGYNSRLDTLQAVVGNWLIGETESIAQGRIERAEYYDAQLADIPGLRIPERTAGRRRVYHLYIVFAERRDELLAHCLAAGIEAKVHYPIPVYRQQALAHLGHRVGDFPVTDRHATSVITFPCDQHLTREEQDWVVEAVRRFYRAG
ncbi:MAG: DegT/DnrJ/EryC1/StrS family aminotransferase [Deltaproteobacteria bacterium]|nr:DegT/DnrJ/EryC1/StrS family aminotransferase [Nannocystaceae bacterium]